MPLQASRIRLELGVRRKPKSLTLQAPIFIAVVEFCADAIAHYDPQVFVEGQISGVKDAMDIFA